jgi:hypothetical protein
MNYRFPTGSLGYTSKTKTVNLVIAAQERQMMLQPKGIMTTTAATDATLKNGLKNATIAAKAIKTQQSFSRRR